MAGNPVPLQIHRTKIHLEQVIRRAEMFSIRIFVKWAKKKQNKPFEEPKKLKEIENDLKKLEKNEKVSNYYQLFALRKMHPRSLVFAKGCVKFRILCFVTKKQNSTISSISTMSNSRKEFLSLGWLPRWQWWPKNCQPSCQKPWDHENRCASFYYYQRVPKGNFLKNQQFFFDISRSILLSATDDKSLSFEVYKYLSKYSLNSIHFGLCYFYFYVFLFTLNIQILDWIVGFEWLT